MPDVELQALPPADALRYFEGKGYTPSFDWPEVWQEEHARAFTVAKAMRLDILEDIRREVDAALRDGITFQQFRTRLEPTLRSKGWWGRQLLTDPSTGLEETVQLGSPRRLRIIYDTNLRMARAAGRWAAIERTRARRPWLRYSAVLDGRTRPEHRTWHDTILPADDPFWDTHYPPNGWNCRCTVVQLSDRDLQRYGFTPSDQAPPVATRPYINKRTGEIVKVPRGIDPGFGYNVGKAHMRGLTPPPRSGPLTTPAINPSADIPLPPPRKAGAEMLLPDATEADEAIEKFLAAFGTRRGEPRLFTDKLGDPLIISDDFFFTDEGVLKLVGRPRTTAVLLLAETIKDPDEIWWVWEHHAKTGAYRLRKRYFARFEIDGKRADIMTAFDVSKDGWLGVTAFRAKQKNYLERQRGGTLAYRRGGDDG